MHKAYAVLGLAAIVGLLRIGGPAEAVPRIEIISVPPFGQFGWVTGRVVDISPSDHYIAAVIFFPGAGWYSKPYYEPRVVEIASDGMWAVNAFWVGTDQWATLVEVYAIPKSSYPACYPNYLEGDKCVPDSLKSAAVACARAVRSGQRQIVWSGHQWTVKHNTAKVGPGGNYFSFSNDNVWVDDQGRLHLRITKRDDIWYCAEIWLNARLGYGTYRFYVDSALDSLDPNVVLSPFTWSDPCSAPNRREMDIEFSRWGDAASPNAQFVVQPFETPGNRERFSMPGCATSTHSMTWTPGRVSFCSVCGHCADPTQCTLVHEWEVSDPERVPLTLDERVHLNLWLMSGLAPTNGQEVEVVISRFEFEPAPPARPIVGASNRAAADLIIDAASSNFEFKLWGCVRWIDCDHITISDGTRTNEEEVPWVRVLEPWHCLVPEPDKYVYIQAQGKLTREPGGSVVLDASAGRVEIIR